MLLGSECTIPLTSVLPSSYASIPAGPWCLGLIPPESFADPLETFVFEKKKDSFPFNLMETICGRSVYVCCVFRLCSGTLDYFPGCSGNPHEEGGPSHRDPCVSCPNATKKMNFDLCRGSSELYLCSFRTLLCFQSKPTSSGEFCPGGTSGRE